MALHCHATRAHNQAWRINGPTVLTLPQSASRHKEAAIRGAALPSRAGYLRRLNPREPLARVLLCGGVAFDGPMRNTPSRDLEDCTYLRDREGETVCVSQRESYLWPLPTRGIASLTIAFSSWGS